MTDAPIHVIGGGLAGLAAAITSADAGAPVVLYEASDALGGRARSGDGPYGVNLGPHVVQAGGAVTRFLHRYGLASDVRLRWPTVRQRPRVIDERGAHWPVALGARAAAAILRVRQAPVDQRFDEWARATFGDTTARELAHLAGLFTFHHDPGSLSARFVWTGYRRTLGAAYTVRYVEGGWGSMVGALAEGARRRGARIELGARLGPGELPQDGPVIVATPQRVAGQLLGRDVSWATTRTALLDVALDRPGPLPTLLMDVSADLGGCCMVERFTSVDPTLAPPGIELVQAHLGIAPDVEQAEAIARVERSFDGLGSWRPAEMWRRELIVEGATAVDLPGTTWTDRPAIDQGDGAYLAGDAVASPGLLSEVAINSAVRAAQLAVADRRRRQWAVGWPSIELTAADRGRILAAAVPGALVTHEVLAAPIDEAWTAEPVDEVEPHRVVRRRRRHTEITSATSQPDGGTELTTVRRPASARG
jgi:phytoene dehydrogenase-like protein